MFTAGIAVLLIPLTPAVLSILGDGGICDYMPWWPGCPGHAIAAD